VGASHIAVVMERSLFAFVWKYSRREQLALLLLTVLTFPILYATLELPKVIINDAIGAQSDIVTVFGYQYGQVTYLLLLCFAFLLTVIAWGVVKMRLNTMKGIMAERLLRRFRYQLISRVLRFPLPHFRRTSQGEMVSIVTGEAEPLGGIMGDAIAQPVFQAGQMLTILAFLFVQSVWLGLTSIALIPLQAWLIPKLQRQVNLLNIERVQEVRRFSERIGETIAGVEDIRANGVAPFTMAHFSNGLGRLFDIRLRIYEKKFFMKFVNNLISQITPFFFFAIGGYLVIKGNLTIGALVAALAAFKDLSSPWRELLAYYNQTQDMSLRYKTIIEQFDPPGMLDAKLIEGRPESYPRLNGSITFENVTLREPDGGRVLDDLSLSIPQGSAVAIQVPNGSERRALSHVLSRSVLPSSGRVMIGEHDLNTLHQGAIAARIGVAGNKPYLFKGKIQDNTRLSLRTLPDAKLEADGALEKDIAEALRVGNSTEPVDVPWLDLSRVGFEGEPELYDWWQRISQTLGTDGFLFKRGLDVTFDPKLHPRLAKRIVALRPEAMRRMVEADLCEPIHPFDRKKFNPGQAFGGNILYAASKRRMKPEELAHDPDFASFLTEAGLTDEALHLGADLLSVIALTFSGVGGGHPLFRRLGLETELFQWLNRIDQRRSTGGVKSLCDLDAQLLRALPFCFTAEQFGSSFKTALKEKILLIRHRRSGPLGEWGERMFSPIDPGEFIEGITVLENLAFGRVARQAGPKGDKLHDLLGSLLEEEGLRGEVAGLIGDVPLTAGGTNLSAATHERLAFIRAAMRKPDILVLDNALQSQEATERVAFRDRVRDLLPEATIIYLEPRVERPEDFDLVLDIADGKLAGDEAPQIEDTEGQTDLARKIKAFGRTSLFDGLSRSQLRLLAFASDWFETKEGEFIYHEGEDPNAVYLVTDGLGELVWEDYAGSLEFDERWIRPGRLIGDLSVIQNRPRALGLVARENVEGLRIGASEYIEVISADPEIAMSLLRTVSGYLGNVVEQLRDEKMKGVEKR